MIEVAVWAAVPSSALLFLQKNVVDITHMTQRYSLPRVFL
jgi:hypothetical protein